MYKVVTHAWCGMTIPHDEFEDLDDAQDRLNQRCEWLRKQGCDLTFHSPHEIEVHEPEDCMMVPDFCGMLILSEVETVDPDDDEPYDDEPLYPEEEEA